MTRARERCITSVLALALAVLAGCGDGGSETAALQTTETAPSPEDAKIARTFDRYLAALNRKDGLTVCEHLAVSSFETLNPPEERESCAEAVTDSIGHPGPTGLRWKSAKIVGNLRVQRAEKTAKLFVRIENAYKNGPKTSEDEIVSMTFESNSWRLAEPDDALLHAIGQK